jgi:hypothetical protein
MVGWVAKLGTSRSRMCSYSIAEYGAQADRDWQWYPDAGNGVLLDGRNISNDPNDANVPADTSFQKDWVGHLLQRWGPASSGGALLPHG